MAAFPSLAPMGPAEAAEAMRLALAEARRTGDADDGTADGRAVDSRDVPVGCVILGPGGQVIGRGRNLREETGDPTAHAEIVAIREAATAVGEWRLTGCSLVVTLEPCTMCAGAVVAARVSRLVFGAWDPKAGAVGSLWDVVRDRRLNVRPEVLGGVLADECGDLLREFFQRQRGGR